MDILEGLGVRFVNIAGGEPTILKGLGRLISHLNNHTTLAYSVVSNSMFNDEKLNEMADAGLKAYVASIDVIDGESRKPHDLQKSSAGLIMLDRLKQRGIPYLCANIVISARNLNSVVDVAGHLSEQGYWVNLCPVIWGRGDKWETVEEGDNAYRLSEDHKDKLEEIASKLIEMKQGGALILPTESYLADLPRYGANLEWKCFSPTDMSGPSRLIVDADGSIMTCINMRGDVTKKYTIFDFKDPDICKPFAQDWWQDAQSCKGCYWSTMVTAKERQLMLEKFQREAMTDHGTQK
jgi:MoaA/NifB/PqqE/SkfB family radical SAM enzyme